MITIVIVAIVFFLIGIYLGYKMCKWISETPIGYFDEDNY